MVFEYTRRIVPTRHLPRAIVCFAAGSLFPSASCTVQKPGVFEQDGDAPVRSHQVRLAVPVQVADGDREGTLPVA